MVERARMQSTVNYNFSRKRTTICDVNGKNDFQPLSFPSSTHFTLALKLMKMCLIKWYLPYCRQFSSLFLFIFFPPPPPMALITVVNFSSALSSFSKWALIADFYHIQVNFLLLFLKVNRGACQRRHCTFEKWFH